MHRLSTILQSMNNLCSAHVNQAWRHYLSVGILCAITSAASIVMVAPASAYSVMPASLSYSILHYNNSSIDHYFNGKAPDTTYIDLSVDGITMFSDSKYPYLDVQARANWGGGLASESATVSARLTYYFEIFSAKSQIVPVDVLGFTKQYTSYFGNGISNLSSSAQINFGSADGLIVSSVMATNKADFQVKKLSGTYSFKTNTQYNVILYASANLNGNDAFGSGGGFATATVDPVFTLASSVPQPQDYTFVFSNGIGNKLSPVPLPASAPMFGAGLLGLAGLSYAAKRKKVAAAA